MKKKMSYIVFSIMLFCIFVMPIHAIQKVSITGNEVRFRSEPTVNSGTIYSLLYVGDELTLINQNGGTGNGCNVWYKVQSGSTVGYICSDFATIIDEQISVNSELPQEEITDYPKYLRDLGFPESYINSLVVLHSKHPNWQFKILNTGLDFNNTVVKEYDGYSRGWSLIEDTGSYYDGLKSTDSWSYNYLTNKFSTSFEGGGYDWYAASKQTIGYYLDPRNFLNDSQIFMFESLSFNATYHTKTGVQGMLKGTFMESALADEKNNLTYADAFMEAASKNNVSPYTLVSRVIQEVGSQGSTITSGTVSGYEGYYNFYNIGAYGNSAAKTIENGLIYAKSKGWDTPYKAIVGGGSFLGDSYISAGQDSLYLQKWDLIGPNYISHQYMQNIQAPSSEALGPYNRYTSLGLINNSFTFTIPVFKNMPESTKLANRGNPNNYLSSLSVNGEYLFVKATEEKEFKINLSKSTKSIDIAASKVASTSTVNGTGSISLTSDEQIVPITVTAANGDVRIYNITVTKISEEAIAVGEILNLLNIKNDGTYMYGFTLGTDISKIAEDITETESKSLVTISDIKGNKKTSGIVASGDKINIKTDKEEKEYTIIIYGDINSDGKISASDYVILKNHIMDVKKLSELETSFGDANKDGIINAADYVTIKNHIMEVKSIVQ